MLCPGGRRLRRLVPGLFPYFTHGYRPACARAPGGHTIPGAILWPTWLRHQWLLAGVLRAIGITAVRVGGNIQMQHDWRRAQAAEQ